MAKDGRVQGGKGCRRVSRAVNCKNFFVNKIFNEIKRSSRGCVVTVNDCPLTEWTQERVVVSYL